MDILAYLPEEIHLTYLKFLFENCYVSFVISSQTNKKYYKLTSYVALQLDPKLTKHIKCEDVAERGYLSILKWVRSYKDCRWTGLTCIRAAQYGHLDVLKWARSTGCKWSSEVCAMAALGGHLNILEWAYQNGCEIGRDAGSNAARGGHLDILLWLRRNKISLYKVCDNAALGGHLHILKWARSNGYDWDENTCAIAANKDHLDVLEYLRNNGCPWNRTTCENAAMEGHLHVLQWVITNGCDIAHNRFFHNWVIITIIRNGHFEVFKWICDNNLNEPICEMICCEIARAGNLEMLQWARSRGFPWDESTCQNAVHNGHINVFVWAIENGCPDVSHVKHIRYMRFNCPDLHILIRKYGNDTSDVTREKFIDICKEYIKTNEYKEFKKNIENKKN